MRINNTFSSSLLKKFIICQMLSITCILFIHAILYRYLEMIFFYYYNLSAAFIGVFIIIYIKKLNFQQIEPFICYLVLGKNTCCFFLVFSYTLFLHEHLLAKVQYFLDPIYACFDNINNCMFRLY